LASFFPSVSLSGHEISSIALPYVIAMVCYRSPKGMGPTDHRLKTSKTVIQNKPFLFIDWSCQMFVLMLESLLTQKCNLVLLGETMPRGHFKIPQRNPLTMPPTNRHHENGRVDPHDPLSLQMTIALAELQGQERL
jgi:hypothetical protein